MWSGFFVFMYVRVLHVCLMCVEVKEERKGKGVGSCGTAARIGCEPPCGGWELNVCPLEEQPVPLPVIPLSSPVFGLLGESPADCMEWNLKAVLTCISLIAKDV